MQVSDKKNDKKQAPKAFNQEQYNIYRKIKRLQDAKNKPSYQEILTKYPNTIPPVIDQNIKISMKGLKQLLQTVYQKSDKLHLNPKQVQDKLLAKSDAQLTDLYNKLRTYATSIKCSQTMKRAVADKVIKKVSTQLNCPMRQAMCEILLDDFWSTISDYGSSAINRLKQLYRDNKSTIHDVVYSAAVTAFPQAAPLFTGIKAMIGGPVCSQDPYSIDVQYLRCLFGQNCAPAPRKQIHNMYQMNSRMQVSITTLADGTAIAVICPISALLGSYVTNGNFLPFVQVASGSSVTPYANLPASLIVGPFQSQYNNVVNYGLDYVRVKYINTQAAINVRGKLIASFFYQPPNQTFIKNPVTGVYNTNNISITDTQLLQNTAYFRRFSNVECQKLTRLGTLIPQQNFDQCIASSQNMIIGSQVYQSKLPFIIIKFTGCTPSTTIGSMFIDIGISIQPIASMRTIYTPTSRGSYQGVYRALKQCRKYGIPLQWLSTEQASFMFKHHFSEIQFPVHIGQGRYIPLPGLNKIQQDQTGSGLCLRHSLQAIGVSNQLLPYSPIQSALALTDRMMYTVQDQIVFYKILQRQQSFVYVNYRQRHATAVQFSDVQAFFNYTASNKIACFLKTQQGFQPYPVRQMSPAIVRKTANNNLYVMKSLLNRGGVQKNPGPIQNDTIQDVIVKIQQKVFHNTSIGRRLCMIRKSLLHKFVNQCDCRQLKQVMNWSKAYSNFWPQYQKVLLRLFRYCAQQYNLRIAIPLVVKDAFIQANSPYIDPFFIQDCQALLQSDKDRLLAQGVQPNPGPISVQLLSDQQQQPPQRIVLTDQHYNRLFGIHTYQVNLLYRFGLFLSHNQDPRCHLSLN